MTSREDAHSRICIVFVCQGGTLEVQPVLLAASLRRALGGTHELVAAIPTPAALWGAPSAATLDLLRALDVRCVPVANELGRDFPFLNKIACFEIPTAAGKRLFLDSDILCLRGPLDDRSPGLDAPFAAKPADIQSFASDDAPWRLAYAAAGVGPAELELPTTVSRQYGLPYFNSGVVAAEVSVPLAAAWRACCRRISESGTVPNSQWWLDQIGLAVAVRQLGLPFACLDERFNYPAHLKPLDPATPPVLCHYHTPEVVAQEPALRALVSSLCRELPGLVALLRAHEAWAALADGVECGPAATTEVGSEDKSSERESSTLDLLVAGIPGSGESELAALLRSTGCEVALDAPDLREALQSGRPGPVPWGVAEFHRAIHADAREQGRSPAAVASCAPAHYLLRLSALRRALPHARAIIQVRDPGATIAAWKVRGPDELRNAAVAALFPGYRDDPELSRRHVSELDRIARTASAAARRAMLWRFFAELALDHRHEATVVAYTSLVTDPGKTLRALIGSAVPERLAPTTVPMPAVSSAPDDALDAEDWQAIRAICTQAAAELGL